MGALLEAIIAPARPAAGSSGTPALCYTSGVILAVDIWLLPAVAASSASYLVVLAWERIRPATAPPGAIAALLAGLSFVMGAFSAFYRERESGVSPENNIIVMFVAGAAATYTWLLFRKYFLSSRGRRGA